MKLRQPIVAVLGHVDHGKTSILDRIRNTAVARKEAGGITQHIGATEIPSNIIEKIAGSLLEKFGVKLEIPGLLFIDTPGHEAFTSLRKRGGSIADLAVLVIDINEGLMPQTKESIEILKAFKTPFVIAFNKIDRIAGWQPNHGTFLESWKNQPESVKQRFEEMFYRVVGQLSELGIPAERYDRLTDFTSTFSIVPVSAMTGEGIADLIMMIAGLAQRFLKGRLEVGEYGKGVILEVKEVKGLGETADIILYDGTLKKGQYAVIASKQPLVRRVRLVLKPSRMTDIRVEKKFVDAGEVTAEAGVKIVLDNMEGVIPGTHVFFSARPDTIESAAQMEVSGVETDRDVEGLIIKADTIGSLEALQKIFSAYPIRHASVGNITKTDIIKAGLNKKYRIVMGFNVNANPEAIELARSTDVEIMLSNIIYRLQEGLEKWLEDEEKRKMEKELAGTPRPAKLRVLPGCIFRASNPAIVGFEVVAGTVRPKWKVFPAGRPEIRGTIKQLQVNGKPVPQAGRGENVAISIEGINFSRQAKEGDIFYTFLSKQDYKKLKEYEEVLSGEEKAVLQEIVSEMKAVDSKWDIMSSF